MKAVEYNQSASLPAQARVSQFNGFNWGVITSDVGAEDLEWPKDFEKLHCFPCLPWVLIFYWTLKWDWNLSIDRESAQGIIIKVSFKREFIFFLNYSLFSIQIVPFKKLNISCYNNKRRTKPSNVESYKLVVLFDVTLIIGCETVRAFLLYLCLSTSPS